MVWVSGRPYLVLRARMLMQFLSVYLCVVSISECMASEWRYANIWQWTCSIGLAVNRTPTVAARSTVTYCSLSEGIQSITELWYHDDLLRQDGRNNFSLLAS